MAFYFNFFNFCGEHVRGNVGPSVDLGKNHLHGPLYFKLSHQHSLDQVNVTLTIFFYSFSSGQHVLGIFGSNVDPGQHRLHGPFYCLAN